MSLTTEGGVGFFSRSKQFSPVHFIVMSLFLNFSVLLR